MTLGGLKEGMGVGVGGRNTLEVKEKVLDPDYNP